jgi:hypothetical protein
MSLRDILERIAEAGDPILLSDKDQDWKASVLLKNLSEPKLMMRAHFQPGLYIAAIDEGGYLGRVLYKIKQRTLN